ncbi:hypothetical protein jhhlp_004524 [Lomentospora prolificans]|uniref:Uncharacterized protein n=1 Tax=Lomentospora prolificans TaxID=41688 RepID=A0A2N3NBW5_9PEZI|nr:hypothetical protein jhhlp_004524 [Lomentospora prolificans]
MMAVQESPPVKRRRSRSSSVQRMLDLEKKIRMERIKAAPRNSKPAPGLLTDPPGRNNPQSISLNSTPRHSSVNLPSPARASDSRFTLEDPTALRAASQPNLLQNGSYSARARESTGTAAANATRMAITLASAASNTEVEYDPVSSNPQSPSWGPQEVSKQGKKAAEKAARAAKRISGHRLVKPPPSASRTPHLLARQSVPAPPAPPPSGNAGQHQRSSSFGPPNHPSTDSGPRQSRRRADSLSSITSVSSIASKIKASFELPRGRSTTPRGERSSSFLGGIKLQKEREAEAEWLNRKAGPGQESYNIPARYMYRQPADSSVARSHSRSSSCSAVSNSSMTPHLIPNPPPLTFPPQHRYRGPPVALRKPRPISRSRSSSRSPIVGPEGSDPNLQRGVSRDGSRGPQGSRNASRVSIDRLSLNGTSAPRPQTSDGFNTSTAQTGEGLVRNGLSDVAALSAVLNSVDLSDGSPRVEEACPAPPPGEDTLSPQHQKAMPTANTTTQPPELEKNQLPSTSVPTQNPPPEDPDRPASRRRHSSFLGLTRTSLLSPMKPRNLPQEPLPAPEATHTVKYTPDERPPRTSAIRQFRDAAMAAFHIRSTSTARGRRDSMASGQLASGQLSPVDAVAGSGRTSPFPEISTFTTPAAIETPPATDFTELWPGKGDATGLRSRPPLTHHYNLARPSDRSSVSSYDTAYSHYPSTVTPNTSPPQSERGLLTTAGADDGQKILSSYDKSGLPTVPLPATAAVARNAPTPPPGPKSARRAVRGSGVGGEINSGTATTRPKVDSHPSSLKRDMASNELDAEWTQASASLKKRSNRQVLDASLFPKPLALHHPAGSIDSNISATDTAGQGSGASSPQTKNKRQIGMYSDGVVPRSSDNKANAPRDTETPPMSSYLDHVKKSGGSAIPKGSTRPMGSSPLSKPPRGRSLLSEDQVGQILDKVLVQCCNCRYYHDMPTRMYERMKLHGEAITSPGASGPIITAYTPKAPGKPGKLAVRCPWCRHEMGIKCCSGFVAAVCLKEKLH